MPRKLSALQLPLFDLNNYGEVAGGWEPDNSTILRKKYESKDLFRKGTNMPDITARPDSNRLHVKTNLLQCLHLGEWAAKIQIFGVPKLLNEFTFYLPTSHPKVLCMHIAILPGVAIVKSLENDL